MRPPNGQRNPRYPAPGTHLPSGMKAVYVEWWDSSSAAGWLKAEEPHPMLIRSVGIEVSRGDEAIVLSTSYNGGTMFTDQIIIPMIAVKKIVRLL